MLKGQVNISVKEWNAEGVLETVKEINQENKICRRVYELLLTLQSVFKNNASHRIYLSNSTAPESFNITTTGSNTVLASGNTTILPNPYIFTQRVTKDVNNPSDLIYNQRFISPATPRTINSLGISRNISSVITSLSADNFDVLTYLKLSTPIVQATNQVLDISYRLFIDWSDPSLANVPLRYLYYLERAFFGQTAVSSPQFLVRGNKILTGQTKNSTDFIFCTEISDYTDGFYDQTTTRTFFLPTAESTTGLYLKASTGLDLKTQFLGRFVSSIIVGGLTNEVGTLPSYLKRNDFQKTSNLGSVTSHNVNSNLMTYDANNLANSSWKPTITDAVTPDFPSLYLLKITQSGGLGTGRYKVYKTGYGGYQFGLWNRTIADSFINLDLSYQEHNPTIRDDYSYYNYRWIYKWSSILGEETFISYRRTYGVGLYKLTDRGLFLLSSWKLSDYPSLTGETIYDLVPIPATNKIYLATSVGLHEINTTDNTLTTLSSDKCLAVTSGFNDAVFAVFNPSGTTGRISSSISTDWSTAYPVGTQSPAVNWSNVWRLFIDPDSTDYQAMLIEGDTPKGTVRQVSASSSFNLYRRWWNSTSGFTSTANMGWTTNSGNNFHVGDLVCYPLSNSVLVSKGIWVYLNSPEPYSNSIDLNGTSLPLDLMEDVTRSGLSKFSNLSRSYDFYRTASGITLGNAAATNDLSNQVTSRRFLFYGKIAVGQYNQAPIVEFFAATNSAASWIKPKLNSETDIFSIVFTLGEHYSNGMVADIASRTDIITNSSYSLPVTIPNLPTFSRTSVFTSPSRINVVYKVNLDLSGTPSGSLTNYGEQTSSAIYSIYAPYSSAMGNVQITPDKRIIIHDRQTRFAGSGIRMLSPLHVPATDTQDITMQTWAWDGTNWVDDPLNTGAGKPLHTASEALVDGLNISWSDLQPADSKNLVADQYYVFTRITAPNTVPIEAHTPSINFSNYFSLRRFSANATTTIANINSATPMYLKEAALGTTPDTDFYGVNSSILGTNVALDQNITATLNGVTVPVGTYSTVTIPSAGAVNVTFGGRISTSNIDNGKTLVINYTWLKKIDTTESAVNP